MRPTTASPDALVISAAVRSTLLGSNTSSEPTLPFVICSARIGGFRKGGGDGRVELCSQDGRIHQKPQLTERRGAALTLRTASMTLSSFEHHNHAPARGACDRR